MIARSSGGRWALGLAEAPNEFMARGFDSRRLHLSYNSGMSRPDESCVVLAGGSPAAVSAGAPRSRVRACGEIHSSERTVESPQEIARFLGGEQRRGPSVERTLQPREISPRKGGVAEPIMPRRRQQTASARTGRMQDAPGVLRRARVDSATRNRRDPTRWLTSSEGRPYKPSVKGAGAGRESEGLIVLRKAATTTLSEGRSPALVALVNGGKDEGMARWGPTPRRRTKYDNPSASCTRRQASSGTGGTVCDRHGSSGVTSWGRLGDFQTLEVCMRRAKTIGKPCAGNPHARFERGPQETEPQGCGA